MMRSDLGLSPRFGALPRSRYSESTRGFWQVARPDSVLAMIRGGEAILPKGSDWTFSVCAVLSGIIGLIMGLFSGNEPGESVWYGVLGLWWLLIGVTAISFYIYQWRMIRQATRETDAE
jgi:hypothetical protein